MELQAVLGPSRCQDFFPSVSIQCSSSLTCNTKDPEVLLHSVQPSQFRSACSSTSLQSQEGKFLYWVFFRHPHNMPSPAQLGYLDSFNYIWVCIYRVQFTIITNTPFFQADTIPKCFGTVFSQSFPACEHTSSNVYEI